MITLTIGGSDNRCNAMAVGQVRNAVPKALHETCRSSVQFACTPAQQRLQSGDPLRSLKFSRSVHRCCRIRSEHPSRSMWSGCGSGCVARWSHVVTSVVLMNHSVSA
jgi:hypothetical protein